MKANITRATIMRRAAKLRTDILAYLRDRGELSSKELIELTGGKPGRVRDCLFVLKQKKAVQSILVMGYGGAPFSAVYSLAYDKSDEDADDADKPQRRSRTTYPLNHVRDALVAALFGPAPQQQMEPHK